MKCENCSHAEMCRWIDELEGRGCDFFDGEQEPCTDAVSRRDAYGCLTFNGHYDTLNEVYERLSKLPSVTQKSGKWIAINEREPEEENNYLVSFDDGFIATVYYAGNDWELWAEAGEPIAWMPLPKPYKPQERSE